MTAVMPGSVRNSSSSLSQGPVESFLPMLRHRLIIHGQEVSCSDLKSRHSCGDWMSHKGDCLIATLLYEEVFTVWKDTCSFHGLVGRVSAWEGRKHLSRGVTRLNGQTGSTSEGESSKGLISRHHALMGLSHWAAITAERAACPCLVISIFCHIYIHVRQSSQKRAQLAITVFASMTCSKAFKNIF